MTSQRPHTGFEFTRRWFMRFPAISPHSLPSSSREIPSCFPQKESPQDSPGKGSTLNPPIPQPAPQRERERERERERDRERGENQSPSNRPKLLPEKTINEVSKTIPFESKLLPAVLLFLRIYFPKITVTVTVLKFG